MCFPVHILALSESFEEVNRGFQDEAPVVVCPEREFELPSSEMDDALVSKDPV